MAGFMSAASLIMPVLQGVNSIAQQKQDRRALQSQHALALQQLQQRQDDDLRQAEENAATEKEKLAVQAKNAEAVRQAALKRAVARQRARYGSSGIASGGSGSAQAVLLGLFDESEEEKNQRERLDTLRSGVLDQDIEQRKRLNVLQRTQLAEKQRMEQSLANYSSSKSIANSLFDIF